MRRKQEVKFYTVKEMSSIIGMTQNSLRIKIRKLKLAKHTPIDSKRIGLYSKKQLKLLQADKKFKTLQCKINSKQDEINYQQLLRNHREAPVVITYHFYESKMNYMNIEV